MGSAISRNDLQLVLPGITTWISRNKDEGLIGASFLDSFLKGAAGCPGAHLERVPAAGVLVHIWSEFQLLDVLVYIWSSSCWVSWCTSGVPAAGRHGAHLEFQLLGMAEAGKALV